MKKLILIVALSMCATIIYGQEYKMVCKRLNGCPVINGTCQTCEIVGANKRQKEYDDELNRMIEEYNANLRKEYPSDFFEVKQSDKKPSGWDIYMYPTWKGIRVLY